MASWTVDTANIVVDPDGSGGFTLTVPLQVDGVDVADLVATMTDTSSLAVTYKLAETAGALSGFQAWSTT